MFNIFMLILTFLHSVIVSLDMYPIHELLRHYQENYVISIFPFLSLLILKYVAVEVVMVTVV